MSAVPDRPAPARRLQLLLCAAVLGVLLVIGMVVGSLAGSAGAAVYAVTAVLLLAVAAARARRALAGPAPVLPADGRSCTCCTTSQHDPVTVVP